MLRDSLTQHSPYTFYMWDQLFSCTMWISQLCSLACSYIGMENNIRFNLTEGLINKRFQSSDGGNKSHYRYTWRFQLVMYTKCRSNLVLLRSRYKHVRPPCWPLTVLCQTLGNRCECHGSSEMTIIKGVGRCHSRRGTLNIPHCSMAMSAKHRSKCAALHRQRRRLQMSEKLSSGTENPE